jgi:hypothetical protein
VAGAGGSGRRASEPGMWLIAGLWYEGWRWRLLLLKNVVWKFRFDWLAAGFGDVGRRSCGGYVVSGCTEDCLDHALISMRSLLLIDLLHI